MTRRDFLGFFLLGGLLGLLGKKINAGKEQKEKEAMFWRKADEA
ncbi:MAG: hypothetical protein FD156_1385 [Nitrospirae bacterium]|nr:MAG: hypothetical protein FD156_1385 [Nitrospirota bacterium]